MIHPRVKFLDFQLPQKVFLVASWGLVLDLLSTLQQHQQQDKPQDGQQQQREQRNVLARVHEMAILELGDLGEMELAFATLKLSRHLLEECQEGTKVIFEKSNNNQDDDDYDIEMNEVKSTGEDATLSHRDQKTTVISAQESG